MPETIAVQEDSTPGHDAAIRSTSQRNSSQSFSELWYAIHRNRRLFLSIVGTLLGACLLYCLIAPHEYEATARVALHGTQVSMLTLDRNEGAASGSIALQLETLANVMRSDQIAWDVIARLQLYKTPGFSGSFAQRFPDFNPNQVSPDARDWLLERFQHDLSVQTIPRTLVLQIRFRSRDAALSAAVVNALIRAYNDRDSEERVEATTRQRGCCSRN